MDKARVIELAVKIDGWQDTDELGWLYDRAGELPPESTWVEVGCWKGRSFFATAMGLTPRCFIIGFDTWKGNPGSVSHWEVDLSASWVWGHFKLCCELVNALRREDRIQAYWSRHKSTEAPELLGSSPHAVFLDADHRYDPFKADILAWRERLAPGGLLCGHDFCDDPDLEGVQQAVRELLPDFQRGPKTIWWWRKPL